MNERVCLASHLGIVEKTWAGKWGLNWRKGLNWRTPLLVPKARKRERKELEGVKVFVAKWLLRIIQEVAFPLKVPTPRLNAVHSL